MFVLLKSMPVSAEKLFLDIASIRQRQLCFVVNFVLHNAILNTINRVSAIALWEQSPTIHANCVGCVEFPYLLRPDLYCTLSYDE